MLVTLTVAVIDDGIEGQVLGTAKVGEVPNNASH